MSGPYLDDFLAMVEVEFELPSASASPDAKVIADLRFDSLDIVRLALLVDEIGGAEIPEGLLLQDDLTLGQVHHYLLVQEGHLEGGRELPPLVHGA